MTIDKETVMPEKWRNRFFRFVAGGDSVAGNIWHIAFVLIDKEGHIYWIGNDGAGKIKNLAETLEREFVRHEDVSWDHEFQEYDVSSKEAVTRLCKDLARMYEDVGAQASVANMLHLAGYDGAGCVCSDCGEFFETTDYLYDVEDGGGFSYCIDREAYHGIGGLAVSFTRIVCDECRSSSECPVCCDMNNPTTKDLKDKGYWKEQDFSKKFAYDELGICEFCWERFQYDHDGLWNSASQEWKPSGRRDAEDMERLPNDIKVSEVLEHLEESQEKETERWDASFLDWVRKYAKWQTDEGVSRADVEAALVRQILVPTDDDVNYLMKVPSAFAYGVVRNVLIPLALKYFGCQLDHVEFEPTDLTEFWKEVFNG